MKKIEFAALLIVVLLSGVEAFSQRVKPVRYASDDDGHVYTSVDEAVSSGKTVYRLKLTKLQNRDSLPEEVFDFAELRELTVKGVRLCILNRNISKLKHLKILNLDRNKLVRLPETLCELPELESLVISRNMIESLPDNIGNMKSLKVIDAWDNPLYVLPQSIVKLRKTLNIVDLRQIPLTKWEYEAMEELLPNTVIMFTNICECENRREHN